MASALVSPETIKSNQIPVRLINTSSKAVKLARGITLGYLQEIDGADLLEENVDLKFCQDNSSSCNVNDDEIKCDICHQKIVEIFRNMKNYLKRLVIPKKITSHLAVCYLR